MSVKGYYRFNGNSNDAGSLGLNGSGTNMSYSSVGGKLHGAAVFNGTSAYVTIGSSSTVYNLQNFTISLWVKGKADSPAYGNVLDKMGVTNKYPFSIRFRVVDSSPDWIQAQHIASDGVSTSLFVCRNYTIGDADKWMFFSMIKNGDYGYGYHNGKYYTDYVAGIGDTSSSANVRFGAKATSPAANTYFKGSVSEAIIDDNPWSIADLMNKYASDIGFF